MCEDHCNSIKEYTGITAHTRVTRARHTHTYLTHLTPARDTTHTDRASPDPPPRLLTYRKTTLKSSQSTFHYGAHQPFRHTQAPCPRAVTRPAEAETGERPPRHPRPGTPRRAGALPRAPPPSTEGLPPRAPASAAGCWGASVRRTRAWCGAGCGSVVGATGHRRELEQAVPPRRRAQEQRAAGRAQQRAYRTGEHRNAARGVDQVGSEQHVEGAVRRY